METQDFLKKVLIPILLLFLSFLVPLYSFSWDVNTFMTLVSLVFAILIGFFIATATANYINLQIYLAEEGASLIILHNLAKLVQPSGGEKLAEKIDTYLIRCLDYPLGDFVRETGKEFNEIIASLDELEPQDSEKRRISALNYMHETKSNLMRTRELIAVTTPPIAGPIHWTILITLTAVIEILLLSLRTDELVSYVVTGTVTALLYCVLILFEELDDNTYLEKNMALEDAERVFVAIGKLPYYPETALKRRLVKGLKNEYRVGEYMNYRHSRDKNIRIVSTKE